MSAVDDARRHLDTAREFLGAAELSDDEGLYSAAASSAAISGINSKDAICLRLSGRTNKTERHADAARELAGAGPAGAAVALTLDRLVRAKTRAQCQSTGVSAAEAHRAVGYAQRLFDAAQQVVGT